jgi:uncharacterized NAD(P)/FAD-binding protein YdhS
MAANKVVIVGGGFSGAMTAVNIARLSDEPLDVTVVNRRPDVGRGVAYARRRPEYLLNVPAQNMSAFHDEPDHFLLWLRTRQEFESTPEAELRERFIPRQIYGDYLHSIVQHHLAPRRGARHVRFRSLIGDVVDIEPLDAGCSVHLADGSALDADRVVIATGNEAPAALPGTAELADHPSWVPDPWQPWEQRLPRQGSIVILGTGLTTVDAVIALGAVGWHGDIHAVSRHGWFPHAHFRCFEYPDFPPPGVDLASLGLDRLVDLVQMHCAILEKRNVSPAIIVDKLRPYTQRIWEHFTDKERLTFARQHAARWNVLRHRIAPELHAQVTRAERTGQLRVHTGSIARLEGVGNRILVQLGDGESVVGDLVVNATGPSSKLTATRSNLLRNLLHDGLIAPDSTDMGIRVDPDHTVLTGEGTRSPYLLALGPLLKGTYWESIAVPELRGQAKRVAETVLGRVSGDDNEAPALLQSLT